MDKLPISQLEDEWRDAILAHDESTLRRILHPKFTFVAIRGAGTTTIGIDQWFDTLSRMEIEQFSTEVTDIQHEDRTAIAIVLGSWRASLDGQTIDENFLLTDIWVDAPGLGWCAIRRHSSPYPRS